MAQSGVIDTDIVTERPAKSIKRSTGMIPKIPRQIYISNAYKPTICVCIVAVIVVVIMVTQLLRNQEMEDEYEVCEFQIIDKKCQYNTVKICTRYSEGIRIDIVENTYTVRSLYDEYLIISGSVDAFNSTIIGSTDLCYIGVLTIQDAWCAHFWTYGFCDQIWINAYYFAKTV